MSRPDDPDDQPKKTFIVEYEVVYKNCVLIDAVNEDEIRQALVYDMPPHSLIDDCDAATIVRRVTPARKLTL